MPAKSNWTEAQDNQIKRLRNDGATWDDVAAALGLARGSVIERGRRIGARRPPPDFVPAPEDPGRDPLPPGHPRTWTAITAGTSLDSVPYPLPVFRR